MERTAGFIYRNLLRIHPKAIALCITVGEETSLQHLIGRKTDTFHNILRIESSLFYLGEVILRITIQLQDTYVLQRKIFVRPYFRKVKGVNAIFVCLLFRHQLNLELPLREVTLFNTLVQIALVRFTILGNDSFGFLVAQVLDPLQGTQMELHPNTFVGSIIETISMAAETMHVTIRIRNTTRAHGDGHLMQRLR